VHTGTYQSIGMTTAFCKGHEGSEKEESMRLVGATLAAVGCAPHPKPTAP
jgi:hypothetical protein